MSLTAAPIQCMAQDATSASSLHWQLQSEPGSILHCQEAAPSGLLDSLYGS